MDMQKALIVAASILGGSIVLSQGIYSFHSVHVGAAQRYNRFTGGVELCAKAIGCIDLTKEEKEIGKYDDLLENK
jgi:hypothetical protein